MSAPPSSWIASYMLLLQNILTKTTHYLMHRSIIVLYSSLLLLTTAAAVKIKEEERLVALAERGTAVGGVMASVSIVLSVKQKIC